MSLLAPTGCRPFTITAQGQPCDVSLGQEQNRTEHVPTVKELADAEQFSWVRIPKYDYAPSDRRLTVTLYGGITHRQSAIGMERHAGRAVGRTTAGDVAGSGPARSCR